MGSQVFFQPLHRVSRRFCVCEQAAAVEFIQIGSSDAIFTR